MRILLIMNPGIPVPPVLYGGIERVVYLLAQEYHKMGHEVTLLAGHGSHCSGTVITIGAGDSEARWPGYREIGFAWKFLMQNHKNFDLIHNFGRLIYLLPIVKSPTIKVMSYQRAVSAKGIKLISSLPARSLLFTGCSNYCVSTGNVAGTWKTVYNTINFDDYQLTEQVADDAPLMFLGRLDQIKGAHTAIRVARETSNKLIIAGNIPDTEDNYSYYKSELEPQFDGEQIIYIGAVDDRKKNEYLGKCKALLFPIEWDEPFGIVMIEAMACGTPVIAFKRGAVPEVINEQTGVIVNSAEEMTAAVRSIDRLDRAACRRVAVERFDISIIANEYLNSFQNA
ncbi:MAG TPA: glycosyltransferase family 4 protein [Mucilaginibacter sp.]|jgi:glycosyltransferase involved in cell wall biosynthesis